MIIKDTFHWKNKSQLEGLLFFAQVVDEALFDYSLDSYKPMALSPRVLCIEMMETITNVKKGLIKEPNVKHLISELKWSLNSDLAVKDLLSDRFDSFVEEINRNENDLTKLHRTISLLFHYFDKYKYLNKVVNLLIEKIKIVKGKEDIYELTKKLLTELINYGYNPNYIYFTNKSFFFNPNNEINNLDQIQSFLKKFDFKKHQFTVVFKGSRLFEEFKMSTDKLEIEFEETITPFSSLKDEIEYCKTKSTSEIFIVCKNIEALDHSGARIFAEKRVQRIANLFSFFHHNERPKICDYGIIRREDNYVAVLDSQIKSIIKRQDIKPKVAARQVLNITSKAELSQATVYRLTRAIDLHGVSLETTEIENQLLNLWTAFETLIPKDENQKEDRIVQLIDSIVPFQVNNYITKVIEQFINDLYVFDRDKSEYLLKHVNLPKRDSTFRTFCAFVSTKENADLRNEFMKELAEFPLLRFRLFSLNKILNNCESIKKYLDSHKQKLEWHLRRIYRNRNLIVHSGEIKSYTRTLVENLHDYLDVFLESIIKIHMKEKRIRTIGEGILESKFSLHNHFKKLQKNKSIELTTSNYIELLNI